MNIIFLNSYLFPFLALALVPLLLHLFAKTKPKIFNFSSNMFIIRASRKNLKLKRPFDILLLIIRTVFFLSLIAIFLQPLLFLFPGAAKLGQVKSIVIIIDSSASMGCLEDGRTRFAAACSEASEILSGLKHGDNADIIWLKSRPCAEFSFPGSNLNYLQNVLSRKSLSYEAGNSSEALKLAFEMLKDTEGNKQVCIISDFQTAQWKEADFEPPVDVKVSNIKIGRREVSNLAVNRIMTFPEAPLKGESVDIFCEIRNFSPEPRSCTVFFNAEAARQSRKVMIPAWGSATAMFKHTFEQASDIPIPVKVSISEDEFPADNSACKLLKVRESLKVALYGSDRYPAEFWIKAVNSLGFTKLDKLKSLEGKLDGYDIIMLSGWNGDDAERLKNFTISGKAVICAPTLKLGGGDFGKLLGIKKLGSMVTDEKNPAGFHLKLADKKDAVFKIFSGGEFGDPCEGVFKYRKLIDNSWLNSAEKLITYGDGQAALARYRLGKGMLLLWNISLDPKVSYWAYRSQFVPFLAEILISSGGGKNYLLPDHYPGQRLSLKLDNPAWLRDLYLETPAGNKQKLKGSYRKQQFFALSSTVKNCGVFKWQYMDKTIGLDVVNFPPVESDLRTMSQKALKRFGVNTAGGHDYKMLDSGLELWPALLLTAVILFLLESLIVLWSRK